MSNEPIPFEYIRAEGKAGRMGAQLMAIVTEGSRGRSYYNPSGEHVTIAESAEPSWKPVGDIPEKALGFRVQLYGMDEYHKLFTPRQLTALTTFSDLVHEARELAIEDALKAGLADDDVPDGSVSTRPLREGGRGARAYGEAVSVYLAFGVDRGADYWSALATWHTNNQQIRATFARHAIPMTWDYSEANPFSDSSGGWNSLHSATLRAFPSLSAYTVGHGFQADAQTLTREKCVISTDPPYYDNIGYADLSDFLYVWLRRAMHQVFPNVFGTLLVPKAEELIASTYRHSSTGAARTFFEDGMIAAFARFRNYVEQEYPLSIYYAYKQRDSGSGSTRQTDYSGWETILGALVLARFQILGTWPVRSEQHHRMIARGSNALASSIVLVCRPRPDDAPATSRRRFLDTLRAELPTAIRKMKTGDIGPVDLPQASIGPGMAIYSRYSAVLEADGSPLTVRAALSEINKALDAALEEPIAGLDAETQFAVQWFGLHGYREGSFGDADNMARGKNTSVESVALAGVAKAEGGKVRLVNWKEYAKLYPNKVWDPKEDKRPTAWEGTHHLVERLNSNGEVGAAALFNRLPSDIAESVRDLAYRLHNICERKGWAEDALDYNVLGSSWSEISRLAASERDSGTQAEMAFDPE